MLQELLNGFGRNVGTWKYCLAKKSFVSRWQFHEGFVLPILFSFQFSSNQFRLFKTKPAKGEKACLFFHQSKSNETYARIISLVFQLYSSCSKSLLSALLLHRNFCFL